MFTRELVDAFDASAAFLYCLESQIFTPYKEQGCDFNQDLRQRAEYAEWRAYDVAVALRSGRAPTEVADAFDDTDGGGEFLNAGVAGISLAAAAPPPGEKAEEGGSAGEKAISISPSAASSSDSIEPERPMPGGF